MSVHTHAQSVYLTYDQRALDRAYDQALWADNMQTLTAQWAVRGESCRTAQFGYGTHAYGRSDVERVDVFATEGRIMHLHLHGGAWRRQTKEQCSFLAPAMAHMGVPLVVPEFGALPAYRMPDVLEQIIRAVQWTSDTFLDTGRADGIVISGHSSGAHMAALVAAHDFGDALPAHAIRAVICLSGPYDLEPVMLSARRDYIHLTPEEQDRLNPMRRIGDLRLPLHLLYGTQESPEFIRQSQAFAQALDDQGKLADCHEVAGANHFEIIDQLGTAGSPVARHFSRIIGDLAAPTASPSYRPTI